VKTSHPNIAAGHASSRQVLGSVGRRVPDGVTLGIAHRPHPRGVRMKPASESPASAVGSRRWRLQCRIPSTRSNQNGCWRAHWRPTRPAPWRGMAGCGVVGERQQRPPPRSRNQASSPSTSTTSAPALRPGRAPVAPLPAVMEVGQGSAAPLGLAGSAAARATARYSGRSGSYRRGSCAVGRRSMRPRTGRRPVTRRNSRAGTCPRPRRCFSTL